MLLAATASTMTNEDMKFRARIIRDVLEECIDQLEERFTELRLLTVDSTAPEHLYMIHTNYDRALADSIEKMKEFKAYSASTDDMAEFLVKTSTVVTQIRDLLRSLIVAFPGGLETLNKHSDLLAHQRMWSVDLEVALFDLAMDMDRLAVPRDAEKDLKWIHEKLHTAFEQMGDFIRTARALGGVKVQEHTASFEQIDFLLSQITAGFTAMGEGSSWQSLPQKRRREGLEFLQKSLMTGMMTFSHLIANPDFELNVADMLDLQDQHVKIVVALNLVKERLDQLTPKSRNHIEELIRYLEDYHKDQFQV